MLICVYNIWIFSIPELLKKIKCKNSKSLLVGVLKSIVYIFNVFWNVFLYISCTMPIRMRKCWENIGLSKKLYPNCEWGWRYTWLPIEGRFGGKECVLATVFSHCQNKQTHIYKTGGRAQNRNLQIELTVRNVYWVGFSRYINLLYIFYIDLEKNLNKIHVFSNKDLKSISKTHIHL